MQNRFGHLWDIPKVQHESTKVLKKRDIDYNRGVQDRTFRVRANKNS
jgi:hypothetical protein